MADIAGAYGWEHEAVMDLDMHWFYHYLKRVDRVVAQRQLATYVSMLPFYVREQSDGERIVRDMQRRARGEQKRRPAGKMTLDERRKVEREMDAGLAAAGLMPFVGQFIINR